MIIPKSLEYNPLAMGIHPNDVETIRWSDFIIDNPVCRQSQSDTCIIGVLKGEGIGPEVTAEALKVLSAIEEVAHRRFEVYSGGEIGLEAEIKYGASLPDQTSEFCRDMFSKGGAILAGPGGGRFVYNLRKRFDLFCKINPLKPIIELNGASRVKPEYIRGADIIIVRDNIAGSYQGKQSLEEGEQKIARCSFEYEEKNVRRIVEVAARIAASRSGRMMVVLKDGGLPSFSQLWRECATEIARRHAVDCSYANIDYAAYLLIQQARDLDVIVTSNLFGDVLSDLGGVLLGSRGMCYSGNFAADSSAVYQTNHGAAYDLAGKDAANPIAQILSLAMLLSESFSLARESSLIHKAVKAVLRDDWRTFDINEQSRRVVGTRQMGDLIAAAVIKMA